MFYPTFDATLSLFVAVGLALDAIQAVSESGIDTFVQRLKSTVF
jgi:hypothetical protein